MKRKLIAGALSSALFVAGYQSSARAIGFPPIPPILPDICASITGCDITFTDSQLLLQIQQYFAMVQNFKNVANQGGLQGAIQQVVGIVNTAESAPPQQAGNVAAQQVIATESDANARIAAIDAQAQAADGVQQQAQVQSLYSSTIAGEVNKTNALLSEQVQQKKAQDEDAVANVLQEAGPASTSDPGSDL